MLDGTLHELTYLENTGFIYDPGTLRRCGTFHYVNQGWRLTHAGAHLIMSDGYSAIQFLGSRLSRPPIGRSSSRMDFVVPRW